MRNGARRFRKTPDESALPECSEHSGSLATESNFKRIRHEQRDFRPCLQQSLPDRPSSGNNSPRSPRRTTFPVVRQEYPRSCDPRSGIWEYHWPREAHGAPSTKGEPSMQRSGSFRSIAMALTLATSFFVLFSSAAKAQDDPFASDAVLAQGNPPLTESMVTRY